MTSSAVLVGAMTAAAGWSALHVHLPPCSLRCCARSCLCLFASLNPAPFCHDYATVYEKGGMAGTATCSAVRAAKQPGAWFSHQTHALPTAQSAPHFPPLKKVYLPAPQWCTQAEARYSTVYQSCVGGYNGYYAFDCNTAIGVTMVTAKCGKTNTGRKRQGWHISCAQQPCKRKNGLMVLNNACMLQS